MPNQMSRAQTIKAFLEKKTHPDLASLYTPAQEVQLNVARDGGIKVENAEFKAKGWRNPNDAAEPEWYPIRIPKDAGSEPIDNGGFPMTYDIVAHAEGIGMTGWDFQARVSRWVAYDFDAIVGHSDKHAKKLSDADLAAVKKAAQEIPWVTVRKSTSGSGLHLYVFLASPEPTKNHNEHAALARAILGTMSAIAGFDFGTKVDVCGGNMWVWHRKMPKPAEGAASIGLSLVKQGIPLADVPKDWKQHVAVIKGERRKSLPEFIEDQRTERPDIDAIFDELCGQHPRVRLDDEHKRLVKFLQENQGYGWWDADHHMLVTHTRHLMRAHEKLELRGIFKTDSPGTEVEQQNCFCYPLRGGAWVVRRYTPGVPEAKTWEQDGKGYTKCYFNRDPDLGTASRAQGGVEVESGGFNFREADIAADVARELGADIKLPPEMGTREARLKMHKDGKRLVIEIPANSHDDAKRMDGWSNEKGKWKRIFTAKASTGTGETEVGLYDEIIRHCVTEVRMDAGWYVRVEDRWNFEPLAHVGRALMSLGRKKAETDVIMGASVLKPWVLVSRPFQDEYPGDRVWNRGAAQFRYPKTDEVGEFPHWQKILNHLGRGLDESLGSNGWALANGGINGATYLAMWLAQALQDPYRPLPYLFFYGNQNCGKSMFHEMLDLLITDGIKDAGQALKNKSGFNGELEGGVFCIIEELNLRKNKDAYDKIKDWVTSPYILIHKKNLTPYRLPNTTHWIHCANDHEACPVFPGDTRITMIYVRDLNPEEMIPKDELRELLKREAPHFLNYLLRLEIPASGDRLAVPVIGTSEKEVLAKANRTMLEEFLEQFCHNVPGEMVLFREFFDKFNEFLPEYEKEQWSKIRVSRSLPPQFPCGIPHGEKHIFVGNLSFERKAPGERKLVLKNDRLVPAA